MPEIFQLTPEPPEQGGGMERVVASLTQLMLAHGYRVRLFHRGNALSPRWHHPTSKPARWASEVLLGYRIGRAARQALHADVALVVSHSTVGWFPLGDRVPQAHFYHGTYCVQAEAIRSEISFKGYLKLKWWDGMVWERLSGRHKTILCNSEQTREEVQRFFGRDGIVVDCPLDTALFRPLDPDRCRRRLGLAPQRPVGLFVGSTQAAKGFPLIVELVRRLPEVQWVVVLRGGSPTPPLGPARVLCDVPAEQLPQLYAAADFSLCLSRYESFGMVVAEALACGTPVIATPGGASRLLLAPSPLRHLLVETPDADAAAARIAQVLADPGAYRRCVLEHIRPVIERQLAPESWWKRFTAATGLAPNAPTPN